ncbi:MAG: hypothetical protein V8T62_11170 [Oscillospiraceae bacterium]
MVKILLSLFRRFSRIKNAQPIENRTPACAAQRRNRCVQNQYFVPERLNSLRDLLHMINYDTIGKRTGFTRRDPFFRGQKSSHKRNTFAA